MLTHSTSFGRPHLRHRRLYVFPLRWHNSLAKLNARESASLQAGGTTRATTNADSTPAPPTRSSPLPASVRLPLPLSVPSRSETAHRVRNSCRHPEGRHDLDFLPRSKDDADGTPACQVEPVQGAEDDQACQVLPSKDDDRRCVQDCERSSISAFHSFSPRASALKEDSLIHGDVNIRTEIRNAPAPTKRGAIVEPGLQNKKHKRGAKVDQHGGPREVEEVETPPY